MEKVYVTIAENGEHGLWAIEVYKTLEEARNDLELVAQKVGDELQSWHDEEVESEIELWKDGGQITNSGSVIGIEIHERCFKS